MSKSKDGILKHEANDNLQEVYFAPEDHNLAELPRQLLNSGYEKVLVVLMKLEQNWRKLHIS